MNVSMGKARLILTRCAIALAAFSVIVLLSVAVKWHFSSKSGAHAELLSGPVRQPSQGARLGDVVTATALFKCPWGRRVGART